MTIFKKSITISLSIFLAIVLVPVLFLIPAEKVIFQSDSYQEVLVANRFYEKTPGWMAGFLIQTSLGGEVQGNPVLFGLDQGKLEGILAQIFPAEVLEAQGRFLIDQIMAYLNSETDTLNIVLDMSLFKQRLSGPERGLVVQEILRSWPACTPEQLFEIGGSILMGNLADIPICRPTDEFMAFFENIASQWLDQFLAGLPDQVVILSGSQAGQVMGDEMAGRWQAVWAFYRALRFVLQASPFLAGLLLLMIIAINVWTLDEGLWGLARSFMAAGILVIILAAGLLLSSRLAGHFMMQQLSPTGPLEILSSLRGVFIFVFSRFATWSIFAGLCGCLVGGILQVVYSTVASRKKSRY